MVFALYIYIYNLEDKLFGPSEGEFQDAEGTQNREEFAPNLVQLFSHCCYKAGETAKKDKDIGCKSVWCQMSKRATTNKGWIRYRLCGLEDDRTNKAQEAFWRFDSCRPLQKLAIRPKQGQGFWGNCGRLSAASMSRKGQPTKVHWAGRGMKLLTSAMWLISQRKNQGKGEFTNPLPGA